MKKGSWQKICFEHVSFNYGNNGKNTEYALKQINLTIKRKEILGIIGPTGAGKSTLVNLLPRFYNTTEGKIMVDDVDIRDIQLLSLRQNIVTVLQEITLFSGTIKDNLCFAKPDATDKQLETVTGISAAFKFISALPDKFNQQLTVHGRGLSGGQSQRLAIARALLASPDILILDDATSSLDHATEAELISNLFTYARQEELSLIIISQKVSTIKEADRIVYLDQGGIKGTGSYHELLNLIPDFREIETAQRGIYE